MTYALVTLGLVLVCTLATLAQTVALFRATRPRRPPARPALRAPISVLKPLCGADESLESNLETFFVQDHAALELVFGVVDPADPAIAVVERLRARYPRVRARLVLHDGHAGLNPKIANLRGMLASGTHDLLLVSDSNVSVSHGYVSDMLATYERDGGPKGVGLVTSLIRGGGEQSLGALLDGLHLQGLVAGAVAVSDVSHAAVVVGKSMLFSRARFEAIGGMESVASVLAEDYIMGRMFKEAGYEVRVASEVITNVSVTAPVSAFVKRQLRWALMRSRLKPLVYPLEWLMNPMAVAAVGLALGGDGALVVWAACLVVLRDALHWLRLRGARGLLLGLPLGPLKELLMLGVWALAPFLRTIRWRGSALRVSTGTRLYSR